MGYMCKQMKIIAWQFSDGVFRFIYEKPSGNLDIVSCENYGGLKDFLNYSNATRLDETVDIWSYMKNLTVSA